MVGPLQDSLPLSLMSSEPRAFLRQRGAGTLLQSLYALVRGGRSAGWHGRRARTRNAETDLKISSQLLAAKRACFLWEYAARRRTRKALCSALGVGLFLLSLLPYLLCSPTSPSRSSSSFFSMY